MKIRNSVACIYFSIIIECSSLVPVIKNRKNIEKVVSENFVELRKVFQESRKKRIVAYEHPQFFNCFKNTYNNLSKSYNSGGPLNYIPILVPGGLGLAYYFRKKEKENKSPQNPNTATSHSL